MPKKTFIIHREPYGDKEALFATCTEHDFVTFTNSDSLDQLRDELHRYIAAHVAACREVGNEPFAIPPPPGHVFAELQPRIVGSLVIDIDHLTYTTGETP